MLSQVDLTDVIAKVAVATILALLATYTPIVLKWFNAKTAEVKQAVGERRYFQIQEVIQAAVFAAEQAGLVEDAKLAGADKKRLALAWAQTELDHLGIQVDVARLDAEIEGAVFEHFNQAKAGIAVSP